MHAANAPQDLIDSPYALRRLIATLLLMTFGAAGMYVVSVVLPQVQSDFGVSRSDASLPYTLLMVGFGVGGILMGRLSDRHGVFVALVVGAIGTLGGFVWAAFAQSIWSFVLAHGLMLGLLGAGATFAPLVADTTLWWNRRRGIAVAVCTSGNYLAGAIWPPVTQFGVSTLGWRQTYLIIGIVCGVGMILLAFAMRRPPPLPVAASHGRMPTRQSDRPFGLRMGTAQALLCAAAVGCCLAMAMPQVHIVAYCADLGFGPARGAEMLSLMLACGVVSRLGSGLICDRIGGVRTLLLGSFLQGVALLMFIPFNGLVSLYVVSAMFGLFQGGIIPAYAIIVREYFPPLEAGRRVGAVMLASLGAMALGGWISGAIFDLTGSYRLAVLNGVFWNAVNLAIAFWLYLRAREQESAQSASTNPIIRQNFPQQS